MISNKCHLINHYGSETTIVLLDKSTTSAIKPETGRAVRKYNYVNAKTLLFSELGTVVLIYVIAAAAFIHFLRRVIL